MACSSKSATNCGQGTFEYRIQPSLESDASCEPKKDDPKPDEKPTVPQPGPLICTEYKNDDIDKCGFKNISPDKLNDAISAFIIGQPSTHKVKEMENLTQIYGYDQNPTYMLNIGYVPGCEDFETQVADNPQGKSSDTAEQSISYQTIIRETYEKCEYAM